MSDLHLLASAISACTRCDLHKNRTRAVPGTGQTTAKVMLIGEKPGYYEDQRGLPLIGPTGDYFDQILMEVGLARSDMFITNVVKCVPPKGEMTPMTSVEACALWLGKQMEAVNPRMIVTCGSFAAMTYFPGEKLGEINGHPRLWRGTDDIYRIVIPTYNPAAALYRKELHPILLNDFKVVAQLLEELCADDLQSRHG